MILYFNKEQIWVEEEVRQAEVWVEVQVLAEVLVVVVQAPTEVVAVAVTVTVVQLVDGVLSAPIPHITILHPYHHTSPFSLNVVFAVLFFIFSIPFLIPSIFAVSDAMQYRSVKAVCIDNSYTSGWYYSIYDYTVQGKDYVSRSSEGWELPEEVGKTVKIYYSVSDPSEITENKPFTLGDVALVVLTLVFNGLGAMFVVFAVKIKKKEHSEVMSATSSSDNVSTTENDVKCMYCGSKYSKNLDACPKCGASRK